MHYLSCFLLSLALVFVQGSTLHAYPVAFPWIAPKSLTVLGSPFIDIVLNVDKKFIESCNLEIGEIQYVDSNDAKRIFFMYKEAFPESPIVANRKEPLNLTEEQLANLGIASLRNSKPYTQYLKYTEYGPAFNELDQIRLILRCTGKEDTLCYSFYDIKEFTKRSIELLSFSSNGYTLIDSELFVCGCHIENFLINAKNQGNKILLDLNDSRIASQFKGRIWSWLSYVDVLFLSEDSMKVLSGISESSRAREFLSRVVPSIFVQDNLRIYFTQHGKETLYSSKENPQQLVLGFLFGYINDNVVDYCFHSADLVVENS
ncbi:hypothetical protein [Chlamydia vaughanii]|uniref:hypothetical protein n=1 Tax=Chlamydia vaughanii TaxID=3112552 RepID=UPI0032B123AB